MQQGAHALRDLGLPNRGVFSVAHHSFLADGTLLGSYGRAVHETTRDSLGNGKGDAQRRNAHIPRQQLRQSLLDALPSEAVVWGKRLKSLDEHPSGVTLCFTDGSETHADVVIGADGIWSTVRRQLVPAAADLPLRYLGVVVILGRAPCDHALVREQVFQTVDGDGTRIYTMPFTQPTAQCSSGHGEPTAAEDAAATATGAPRERAVTMWQLSFLATEAEANSLPRSGPELLQLAAERVSGWHAPIEQLIRDTAPSDVTGYPAFDRATPAAFRASSDGASHATSTASSEPPPSAPDVPLLSLESRCTLIGDAAHPMSPFKGQGANQALLDAVDVARALRRSALCGGEQTIAHALGEFERRMLGRAAPKVAASRAAAASLHDVSATVRSNSTRAAAARTAQTSA